MIRFATIGSGHIVEQFLTEAKKHPEFTLTAVYSRTGERAAEFAAQWGAPLTFTDLSSLAACPEVDAVYIASPNLCHAEQAITLMKAGKHILCEKPMATTYIDCDGMVLQAHNSHVILLEGMRTLFAPGFARLHQLIPGRSAPCAASPRATASIPVGTIATWPAAVPGLRSPPQ